MFYASSQVDFGKLSLFSEFFHFIERFKLLGKAFYNIFILKTVPTFVVMSFVVPNIYIHVFFSP